MKHTHKRHAVALVAVCRVAMTLLLYRRLLFFVFVCFVLPNVRPCCRSFYQMFGLFVFVFVLPRSAVALHIFVQVPPRVT